MSKLFTRERFGQPQILAGLMLLVFFGQCLWLTSRAHVYHAVDGEEISRIQIGLKLWGKGTAKPAGFVTANPTSSLEPFSHSELPDRGSFDSNHSALWYLIPATPFLFCPVPDLQTIETHFWMALLPNLAFAVLLGASLWYVARRLYGNAGGYIALAFYCFSPTIIVSSAFFTPNEMGAAWGAFGAVFTAIAVSHTLYAPREVVLWNWKRILLLGLSFALAAGSQFSLILLLPVALLFMFYLAPKRKRAAFTIWLAACLVAGILLFGAYQFRAGEFSHAFHRANFVGLIWKAFTARSAYWALLRRLGVLGPGILAVLPVVLIAYTIWPRTRYFGNTAPLLVTLLLLLLALGSPHYPGFGFELMAVPFLFVFASGVIADFLETKNRQIVLVGVLAAVLAGAGWNIWQLLQMT
jgi:hypothetical protein